MALLDSWSAVNTSQGGTGALFQFPNDIPANRFVVLAVSRGGASTTVTSSNVNGNAWVVERSGAHTSNSMNVHLMTMFTANPITAGTSFTLNFNVSSNRTAIICAVFDNVSPLNKAVMTGVLSTAAPAVNCGPTPELVTPRALVLTAVSMTAAGYPVANSGNKLVKQTVTTAGTNDRGVALFYKNEGGYAHTGSFLVPASTISVSVTAAYQTPDLPAGYLPVMTVDGEVPGKLSYWNGTSEVQAASISIT